jgi:hypothetical protein
MSAMSHVGDVCAAESSALDAVPDAVPEVGLLPEPAVVAKFPMQALEDKRICGWLCVQKFEENQAVGGYSTST